MITTCTACNKTFEQNQTAGITNLSYAVGRDTDKELCYHCALAHLTGGRAPEESDFTSARLISGEMSDKEWKWLQEDLIAVETGRSRWEPHIPSESYVDWYDDDPEDITFCEECGSDDRFCYCGLDDTED